MRFGFSSINTTWYVWKQIHTYMKNGNNTLEFCSGQIIQWNYLYVYPDKCDEMLRWESMATFITYDATTLWLWWASGSVCVVYTRRDATNIKFGQLPNTNIRLSPYSAGRIFGRIFGTLSVLGLWDLIQTRRNNTYTHTSSSSLLCFCLSPAEMRVCIPISTLFYYVFINQTPNYLSVSSNLVQDKNIWSVMESPSGSHSPRPRPPSLYTYIMYLQCSCQINIALLIYSPYSSQLYTYVH